MNLRRTAPPYPAEKARPLAAALVHAIEGEVRFDPVSPGLYSTGASNYRQVLNRNGYDGSFYGHFGDGCLHTRINFDVKTSEGIRKYRVFVDAAADPVAHYGGSFSGEHGDGEARAELLPKLYGEEWVGALREFEALWDPHGRANPAGERVLLAAVRRGARRAGQPDGDSCREQIRQTTGREALHAAQVLRQAIAGQRRADMRAITL